MILIIFISDLSNITLNMNEMSLNNLWNSDQVSNSESRINSQPTKLSQPSLAIDNQSHRIESTLDRDHRRAVSFHFR